MANQAKSSAVKQADYQGTLTVPKGKYGKYDVADLRTARSMLDDVAEAESAKAKVSEDTSVEKKCVVDFLRAVGQSSRNEFDTDSTVINFDNRNQAISKTVAEFMALCRTIEGGKTVVCRAWIDTKSKIKRSLSNGVDLDLSTKDMAQANIESEKTDENGILVYVPNHLDMLSKLHTLIKKQEGEAFSGGQLEKSMNNDILKTIKKWEGHVKTEKNAEQIETAQKVVNG